MLGSGGLYIEGLGHGEWSDPLDDARADTGYTGQIVNRGELPIGHAVGGNALGQSRPAKWRASLKVWPAWVNADINLPARTAGYC